MSFNVLIIEDEEQWQSILEEHIQQVCDRMDREYKCDIAFDFIEARRKIQQKIFDLVFLDVNLGRNNTREGVHFLYLIRTNIRSPIIIVTIFDEKDINIPDECKDQIKHFFNKSKLDPRQFQTAIQEVIESSQKTPEVRMEPSIGDTLAVNILVEAVKFLFQELGKRLEFWRSEKGEKEMPKKFEIIEREGYLLKLDDVEKKIISVINYDRIQNSLEILKRNNSTLNTYQLDSTNPIILPDRKAFLNIEIPRLEKEIELEGNRLKRLIEQSFE